MRRMIRRVLSVWTCGRGHENQPDDTMICLTCLF